MKTLIYKGFGRDGKGEVKFNISVADRDCASEIFVETFTSDQRVIDWSSGEDISLNIVSEILGISFWPLDLAEDYLSLEEWRDIDTHDQSLVKKKFPVHTESFADVASAIKKIKTMIEELRKRWMEALKLHNKLTVELKELSLDRLLSESPLEITISQTVVKK